MENKVLDYVEYLKREKGISVNTEMAYRRDLMKLVRYLNSQEISGIEKITVTNLNSYMLYMEKQGLTNTTISRNVASIKGFFQYLKRQGVIGEDVSESLASPKIERHAPKSASKEDVKKVLAVPTGKTPKLLRDKAMIELLYSTGIMVEELVSLKVGDINMELGYLQCHFDGNQNAYPLDRQSQKAMRAYLKNGRDKSAERNRVRCTLPEYIRKEDEPSGLLEDSEGLCGKGGIKGTITPSMLRHS